MNELSKKEIDVDSFKDSLSCQETLTTLYEMIETVSDETVGNEGMMVPAIVCRMVSDCKARYVGNRLNGKIVIS